MTDNGCTHANASMDANGRIVCNDCGMVLHGG